MSDKNDILFDILQSGGTVMDMPLNEDGSPDGEAFVKSLAEALASIPAVWVRLKNDPEWATKRVLSVNSIVGAMLTGIMSASGTYTRGTSDELHEDEIPENLTSLAWFLQFELRRWEASFRIGGVDLTEASLCEVGAFIYPRIIEGQWFTDKTCCPETAVHNGLIALRTELREQDRFDSGFEARWAGRINAKFGGTEGDGI